MTTTYHVTVTITRVQDDPPIFRRRVIQENVVAGYTDKAKAKRLSRALRDRAQDCIEEVR
jgi:hypothetical protein